MGEKREKKRRYNLRLEYIMRFNAWLRKEPPMWKFRKWQKWKKSKPVWNKRKEAFNDWRTFFNNFGE